MSQFDPNQFIDMQFTESNDTVLRPIPVGEYVGYIDIGTVKAVTWAKKDDPSISGLKLQMQVVIDDARVKEELGRDKVTVRHDVMLDLTAEGGLDFGKGKNVGLGRLREACSANNKGEPFTFKMLEGRPMKVMIAHRVDPQDTSKIYSEVKGVARIS